MRASLERLSADRGAEVMCSIDVLPGKQSVAAFIDGSGFFKALTSIYGVPDSRCHGTMGWTAQPVERPLLTLFHRPQAMPEAPPTMEAGNADVVLAATYTRLDIATVGHLWERLESVIARDLQATESGFQKARIHAWRQDHLNDVLLAAMGDRDLMEWAIGLGATVDAATNWFGKTPLMYAAQNNDLAATEFLVARGADPTARTASDERRCLRLGRDGRTALMYAAENASPAPGQGPWTARGIRRSGILRETTGWSRKRGSCCGRASTRIDRPGLGSSSIY